MLELLNTQPKEVHCHVGSLEMTAESFSQFALVHCHVGSLEMKAQSKMQHIQVHCHVGSLEIVAYMRCIDR